MGIREVEAVPANVPCTPRVRIDSAFMAPIGPPAPGIDGTASSDTAGPLCHGRDVIQELSQRARCVDAQGPRVRARCGSAPCKSVAHEGSGVRQPYGAGPGVTLDEAAIESRRVDGGSAP